MAGRYQPNSNVRKDKRMADYDVYFYCKECKQTHPLGIKIPFKGGPPMKRSIGAVYAGKKLPPKIVSLIDRKMLCPKTGKMFTQKNIHQIFLVPLE
jgi:hypothetical protein